MFRALGFLTILGIGGVRGGAGAPRPKDLPFLPLIGAMIGLVVGFAWLGTQRLFPALVVAALVVAVDALVTGMLHLDGVADSGDGLIAPMDRKRRLAVMRDSSIGAFGALAVVLVLLMRFAVFASIPAAPLAVAALWCLARTAMAVVIGTVRYARAGGGLASTLKADSQPWTWMVSSGIGLVVATVLMWVEWGPMGLIPLGAAVVAAVAMTLIARARIDGFTGDTLGATGVVAETAGLIAMAAL